MGYEREDLRCFNGYVPGEQPLSARAKLNTNENPYQPGAKVLRALRGVTAEALRCYPDPLANVFRQAAADRQGLTADNIVVTNGGDEGLRLALAAFLPPGAPLGLIEPAYGLYPGLAVLHGSPVCAVPYEADWSLPANAAEHWNGAGARLAIVTNPHAPSGRLASVAQLMQIARAFHGVLLVDEAYVDFVEPELCHDTIALVRVLPNVLLLRTLSKGYSLAGLRLGYGIGAPDLIRPMLQKAKDSYNVDAIAQRIGAAAIADHRYAARTWRLVRQERKRVAAALATRGFTCPSSEANFLLACMPAGAPISAEMLYRALADEGIYVRWFDSDRLRQHLRITVGTPDQNSLLLAAIDRILALPRVNDKGAPSASGEESCSD